MNKTAILSIPAYVKFGDTDAGSEDLYKNGIIPSRYPPQCRYTERHGLEDNVSCGQDCARAWIQYAGNAGEVIFRRPEMHVGEKVCGVDGYAGEICVRVFG